MLDYFKPHSVGDWVRIGSELILASVHHIGAISLLIEPGVGIFKWFGWLGEDFHGPRWPFYVAEGENSVRRKARQAIIRSLAQQ
jgi:hypothetical protein